MTQLLAGGRRKRTAIVVGGLLLLLVPLFVPLPTVARDDPTLNLLGDRAHVVIFAALAWLLNAVGPLRGRPLVCAVTAAAVGGASEYIQGFVGRSPLFADWVLDVLGIGLTLTWLQWRRGHRRLTILSAAFLLAVLAYTMRDAPGIFRAMVEVRRSFPLLADFSSRDQLVLWRDRGDGGCRLVDVGEPHGQVLQVTTSGAEPWPGVNAGRMPADWTGYDALVLEARLRAPSPDSLRFALRLDDFAGRDDKEWSSRGYMITHQWRTIRFPLRDLVTDKSHRPLELDDIFGLTAFLARPQAAAVFEIDDVRLEKSPSIDNDGIAR